MSALRPLMTNKAAEHCYFTYMGISYLLNPAAGLSDSITGAPRNCSVAITHTTSIASPGAVIAIFCARLLNYMLLLRDPNFEGHFLTQNHDVSSKNN